MSCFADNVYVFFVKQRLRVRRQIGIIGLVVAG